MRHQGQKKLAACRAMQWDLCTWLKSQAPRPRRLHAIQVKHTCAVQGSEIAALPYLSDEFHQNALSFGPEFPSIECIQRQTPKRRAPNIVAVRQVSRKVALCHEATTDSFNGGLRQREVAGKLYGSGAATSTCDETQDAQGVIGGSRVWHKTSVLGRVAILSLFAISHKDPAGSRVARSPTRATSETVRRAPRNANRR